MADFYTPEPYPNWMGGEAGTPDYTNSADLNSVLGGVQSVLSQFGIGGYGQSTDSQQVDYGSKSDLVMGGGAGGEDLVKSPNKAGGTDFIKGALDFIKNKENGPVMTLAGAMLAGVPRYLTGKKDAEARQKAAEANMLTATSQDEKWRTQMANGSSIGKTNFGIMGTPAYKDLAAVRRGRSGGIM